MTSEYQEATTAYRSENLLAFGQLAVYLLGSSTLGNAIISGNTKTAPIPWLCVLGFFFTLAFMVITLRAHAFTLSARDRALELESSLDWKVHTDGPRRPRSGLFELTAFNATSWLFLSGLMCWPTVLQQYLSPGYSVWAIFAAELGFVVWHELTLRLLRKAKGPNDV